MNLLIYNINNNDNRNNIVNYSRITNRENRNINIRDSENNSIVINDVANRSIGENRVNLSNCLNNECVNIYVTWYRSYNFLLDGRDADIIDLNYKKEWDVLIKSPVISGDYSKMPFFCGSSALFIEIIPWTSTRQRLLIQRKKGICANKSGTSMLKMQKDRLAWPIPLKEKTIISFR